MQVFDCLSFDIDVNSFILCLQEVRITEFYLHPAYNYPSPLNNDFAFFRFAPPVEFNKCVAPICLPEQGYPFQPGIDTYAIGWGNLHCKCFEHEPYNIHYFTSFLLPKLYQYLLSLSRTRLIFSDSSSQRIYHFLIQWVLKVPPSDPINCSKLC